MEQVVREHNSVIVNTNITKNTYIKHSKYVVQKLALARECA